MPISFRDMSKPIDERVKALLNEMTIDEKITLLPQQMAAVERLGVGSFLFKAEAAHGLVRHIEGDITTVFPQPIGLSATWNKELMKKLGEIVGIEARIINQRYPGQALVVWAPTVDLERDPRWGRNEEAYGEDPCLTGGLSTAYALGMRGEHEKYLRIIPSLKHFYANNNEAFRDRSNSVVPPREKYEYYYKAFEPALKSGAALSVMTSYNEINGTPSLLLKDVKDVLMDKWGMLFYVTDQGDYSGIYLAHKYTKNHIESLALTVKAGCSIFVEPPDLVMISAKLAIEQGLITEEDLNKSLFGVMKARFMLGEFDSKENNPYAYYDERLLAGSEHAKLALQATQESFVLLKNDNKLLPVNKNAKVAIIGNLADNNYREWYTGIPPYQVTALEGFKTVSGDAGNIIFASGSDKVAFKTADGSYIGVDAQTKELRSGFCADDKSCLFELDDFGGNNMLLRNVDNNMYVTSRDGLVTADSKEVFDWHIRQQLNIMPYEDKYYITDLDRKHLKVENGCVKPVDRAMFDKERLYELEIIENGIEKAVKAAKESDYAVVVVGNHPHIGPREGSDRTDIIMPPPFEKLIKAVFEANKNTIVVIVSGYQMTSKFIEHNIPALLYGGHSVQEIGTALAQVIYGDVSPSGRLSMTWYRHNNQLPDIMDYDIIRQKATYLYTQADPRYPFGHGLSYCGFDYSNFELDKQSYEQCDTVKIKVDVKNTGEMEAQEVVQVYVSIKESKVKRANRQLKAFAKLVLAPGEIKTAQLEIDTDELRIWDVRTDKYLLETGDYVIDIAKNCLEPIMSKEIHIEGDTIADRDMSRVIQAMNCDDYDRISLGEFNRDGSVAVMGCRGRLVYRDCCFDGQNKFTALVSLPSGGQTLSVFANGGELCEIKITPTCGENEWRRFSASFAPVSGVKELVINFNGNIKEFWFEKE